MNSSLLCCKHCTLHLGAFQGSHKTIPNWRRIPRAWDCSQLSTPKGMCSETGMPPSSILLYKGVAQGLCICEVKQTNQKGKEEQEVGCIEHFQAVYTNFLLILTTALWGVRIHREVAPTHTHEHPHTHTPCSRWQSPGVHQGLCSIPHTSSIPPLCLLLQGVKPLVKLPNTAAAT